MEQKLAVVSERHSLSPVAVFSLTGCARDGHATAMSRIGRWSALSGVQLSAYRTTGSSCEHGNLEPSAGPAKPGKPPSPVTFRSRGGASAVVRARESRAHGEGRQ